MAQAKEDDTMKKKELLRFFLNEKICLILVKIAEKKTDNYSDSEGYTYSREIAKQTDTTYCHVVRVVNKLEECGLIETEKIGRKRRLKTTGQGLEIAVKVSELVNLIKDADLDLTEGGSDE